MFQIILLCKLPSWESAKSLSWEVFRISENFLFKGQGHDRIYTITTIEITVEFFLSLGVKWLISQTLNEMYIWATMSVNVEKIVTFSPRKRRTYHVMPLVARKEEYICKNRTLTIFRQEKWKAWKENPGRPVKKGKLPNLRPHRKPQLQRNPRRENPWKAQNKLFRIGKHHRNNRHSYSFWASLLDYLYNIYTLLTGP